MRIVKDSFLAVQVIESTWTKHAPCVPGSHLESCEDPPVCTAGWVDADRGPDQPPAARVAARALAATAVGARPTWQALTTHPSSVMPSVSDTTTCQVRSAVADGRPASVLAGVKPVHGLYASFAGLIVGGLTASTRLVVITTTRAAALAGGLRPGRRRRETAARRPDPSYPARRPDHGRGGVRPHRAVSPIRLPLGDARFPDRHRPQHHPEPGARHAGRQSRRKHRLTKAINALAEPSDRVGRARRRPRGSGPTGPARAHAARALQLLS
jgi:hypothetical protein